MPLEIFNAWLDCKNGKKPTSQPIAVEEFEANIDPFSEEFQHMDKLLLQRQTKQWNDLSFSEIIDINFQDKLLHEAWDDLPFENYTAWQRTFPSDLVGVGGSRNAEDSMSEIARARMRYK